MIANIQTMEWMAGLSDLTSGDYSNVVAIRCIEDGTVTAHFPTGDETKAFTADMDRSLNRVDINIL